MQGDEDMNKYGLLIIGLMILPLVLTGCDKTPTFQHKKTDVQLSNLNTSNFVDAPTTVQDSQTTTLSEDDRAAITQAILNYLKEKSAVSADDVKITVEKRSGDYARANVVPIKPVTDKATVFLKYESSQWVVLSLGTAFNINFYLKNEIPQELQLK